MHDPFEQFRLAEKAAEDLYFAKIDRELIEVLHERRKSGKPVSVSGAETDAGQIHSPDHPAVSVCDRRNGRITVVTG